MGYAMAATSMLTLHCHTGEGRVVEMHMPRTASFHGYLVSRAQTQKEQAAHEKTKKHELEWPLGSALVLPTASGRKRNDGVEGKQHCVCRDRPGVT